MIEQNSIEFVFSSQLIAIFHLKPVIIQTLPLIWKDLYLIIEKLF